MASGPYSFAPHFRRASRAAAVPAAMSPLCVRRKKSPSMEWVVETLAAQGAGGSILWKWTAAAREIPQKSELESANTGEKRPLGGPPKTFLENGARTCKNRGKMATRRAAAEDIPHKRRSKVQNPGEMATGYLGCCPVAGLQGCWQPKTQQPSNPATQQPSNPATGPSNPATQQPGCRLLGCWARLLGCWIA